MITQRGALPPHGLFPIAAIAMSIVVAGAAAAAQSRGDAGVDAEARRDDLAATDARTDDDAGADAEARASGDAEPVSAADESAADRAAGSDEADAPDPVAEEGERSGSAEGEPLPGRALVGEEIAALSDRACFRALARLRVPFERLRRHLPGVATPVRITGAIHGVRYAQNDGRDIHELMDCRLAVALVRFSRMLGHLGVVEVRHYSTYRPPARGAVARQPIQARHPGGLAIDAAWFIRADGARFGVERDFHGRRGRPVCGPEARVPRHDGARILRTIACDSARRGIFHVVLTPNHNYEHRNHFHMEVTRGANWQFVR